MEGVVFVKITERVPVRVYPSFIGEVAVLDPDLPISEMLKIGCQLRKMGFKLIHEYYDERMARFMREVCEFAQDYEGVDLDDEFDTYLRCTRPHPIMGCRYIYYANATLYKDGGKYVFVAKMPRGTFVWHSEAKNVFADYSPQGEVVDDSAYVWMALSMSDDGVYDRYYVMLDALKHRFGARMYIDPNGNVINSEIWTW